MPQNIFRRDLKPDAPRHVQINCPQRSSCTLFASKLCIILNATVCHRDYAQCWRHVPKLPAPKKAYVVKTTILPYSTLKAWEHTTNASLYRIAYFRNPIDQYASLMDERWSENCGGFVEKARAIDTEAIKAVVNNYYDAVIFAENFYDDPNLLGAHGFPSSHIKRMYAKTFDRTTTIVDRVCGLMPFLCTLYGLGYDPALPSPTNATRKRHLGI